jgi:hypothetical protein
MAMDTAIWVEAAAVTITVGAWAAIAAGTNQQTGAIRPTYPQDDGLSPRWGRCGSLDRLSFAD